MIQSKVCMFLAVGVSAIAVSPALALDASTAMQLVQDALDHPDREIARQSSVNAALELREGNSESRQAIRALLVQRMAGANDALTLSRAMRILSQSPSDDVRLLGVQRVVGAQNERMRQAALSGLCSLLSEGPAPQPAAAESILNGLESIISDKRQPQGTVDGAVICAAACGAAGFDFLMRLQEKQANDNPKVMNVFCTALGGTRDARAMPVLRGFIANAATSEGKRIEALSALGSLVTGLNGKGTINPQELDHCLATVRSLVAPGTPDQVFGAALKCLRNMERIEADPLVWNALINSLDSTSEYLRADALEVLYACELASIQGVLDKVQILAQQSDHPVIQSTAQAILDRYEAESG